MSALDLHTKTGHLLAGKYRIERIIGKGGVGVVVEATHVELAKKVAIKFLQAEALDDPESVERFAREARAAAMICSEHVARVYDVGRLEGGIPYMVMEFLHGTDLDQRLLEGPLSVEETVEYMMQVCEALAEAHSAGIVHRDLKPANLFLARGPDGSPILKILDFGISKVTGRALRGSPRWSGMTTQIMGSPGYMAPEQMRSTRNVDQRADIWALGTVMYELLTGQPAFSAESLAELFFRIAENEPAPIGGLRPEVPPQMVDVVMRCLRKRPEDRFADVAELADALGRASPTARGSGAMKVKRVLARQNFSSAPPAADFSQSPSSGESAHLEVETSPRASTSGPLAGSAVKASAVTQAAEPSATKAGSSVRAFHESQRLAARRRVATWVGLLGVAGVALAVGYSLATRASARVAAPVINVTNVPTPPASAAPPPPSIGGPSPGETSAPSAVPVTSPPTASVAASAPVSPSRARQPSSTARPKPAPSTPSPRSLTDFGDRK